MAIANRIGFVATMDQITFSEAEYQTKKRKTRREIFLERMDKLIPWKQLEKKVARYYPKGQNGRPPYPLPAMLRVHCMQLFYNLSDPAMEDALYDIESMRQFAGLKLDRLPDETTILKFRHFLERPMGIQYFKRTRARVRQLYDFVVPSRNTPFYSFDFGFEEGPAILDDLGVKGLGFLKRSAHRIWEDNTDLFVQLVYRGIRRWFLGGY